MYVIFCHTESSIFDTGRISECVDLSLLPGLKYKYITVCPLDLKSQDDYRDFFHCFV